MELQNLRFYTITLKPVLKNYKGDKEALTGAYTDMLTIIDGQTEQLTFEKVGTPELHLHALISCRQITQVSHKYIMRILFGYHLHKKIISKKADQQSVKDTWLRYIHKERSDADRFYNVFGNMFPLEELS